VATVLVVDDHADTREVIRSVLTAAGHDVAAAGDGEDALRLYLKRHADVVIVDMIMPRLDGSGLIRTLRHDGKGTPKIIAMSAGWGTREGDALQEAERLGADRTLRKPLDLEVLIAVVGELAAGD
jgi:CheY-like chemotaxis protein